MGLPKDNCVPLPVWTPERQLVRIDDQFVRRQRPGFLRRIERCHKGFRFPLNPVCLRGCRGSRGYPIGSLCGGVFARAPCVIPDVGERQACHA